MEMTIWKVTDPFQVSFLIIFIISGSALQDERNQYFVQNVQDLITELSFEYIWKNIIESSSPYYF